MGNRVRVSYFNKPNSRVTIIMPTDGQVQQPLHFQIKLGEQILNFAVKANPILWGSKLYTLTSILAGDVYKIMYGIKSTMVTDILLVEFLQLEALRMIRPLHQYCL